MAWARTGRGGRGPRGAAGPARGAGGDGGVRGGAQRGGWMNWGRVCIIRVAPAAGGRGQRYTKPDGTGGAGIAPIYGKRRPGATGAGPQDRAGASKFVYIQRLTISRCKSGSGIVPTLGVSGEMAEKDTIEELIEQLRQFKDPRVAGRTDHNLRDILVLALCAVMSGAQGWDDIEDWGRAREGWLRRYLKLRNGIPGHDTIRRVFEALSPRQLSTCLSSWMAPSLSCGGWPGHRHRWQESARCGTSGLRVGRSA